MKINSRTADLIQGLGQLIADSGLPPCVVGLALDKLRAQVGALETRAILAERQAQKPEEPQGLEKPQGSEESV